MPLDFRIFKFGSSDILSMANAWKLAGSHWCDGVTTINIGGQNFHTTEMVLPEITFDVIWCLHLNNQKHTLPETNIAPEPPGLEDKFPFRKASCQVLC